MRKALAIIFAVLSFYCFSQEEYSRKKNPRFTIRGNVGIVRPVSSSMFNTCFAGVYEGGLSLNLRLFDNFYAGVGYHSSYFQNSKFLKQQVSSLTKLPYTTNLINDGVYMKLGYDKFVSGKTYISYALNMGMLFSRYTNVNADTSDLNRPYGNPKFSSIFAQPEVSLNFIAEQHLSFSIMISYMTVFTHFDPKAPRFNQFDEIRNSGNRYFMSWINIGFGFNILIGK